MDALNSVSTEKLLSCTHACPPPDRRKIVRIIKDFQALAEKERFELEDFHEIGHNETQTDAIEHNILGAFHNGNQPDTIPVWV